MFPVSTVHHQRVDLIASASKFYARGGRPSSAPTCRRNARTVPVVTNSVQNVERKKASRHAGLLAAYPNGIPSLVASDKINLNPRLGEPIPLDRVLMRWSRPTQSPARSPAPPRPYSAPRIRPASAKQNRFADEKHKQAQQPVESASVQIPAIWPPSLERLASLVAHLTSPSVRVLAPADMEEVSAKLSSDDIDKLFIAKVPDVQNFLFRGKSGEYVLKYIKLAYANGLPAFQNTDLHLHLTWLLRLIVHHGEANAPNGDTYLRDVAEAFMDCQAVQARVIERVGLQIRGVGHTFKGLVIELVDQYKVMSLKMLAYEEVAKLGGPDETNDPPHFENRLLRDIGEDVGASMADVRRAQLDAHAEKRFTKRTEEQRKILKERFRELFDISAMLNALVSELNNFSESSLQESLPRTFLDWVANNLTQKHIVFDEETLTRIQVEPVFVLAILENLFLGKLSVQQNESYHNEVVLDLFVKS